MLAEMYADALTMYTPPPADEETAETPSLRIRTPDFSTQEEADYLYLQKRMNRHAEKRLSSFFYGSCLIAASCIGLYSNFHIPAALYGALVGIFACTAVGTVRICHTMESTWKNGGVTEKEDDSEV
jgi:hypothetical protein